MLAEQLEYSGLAAGHIWTNGHKMWVYGGIPYEISDKLNRQDQIGPRELHGKIRLEASSNTVANMAI